MPRLRPRIVGPMLILLLTALSAQEREAPATIVLDGRVSFADYERLIEREFDVPEGVQRLEVDLEYTGKERRTVLDLGLSSPSGLRGWSGGGRSHIELSRLTATPGYLPGTIEAGRWAVILGVPNIRQGSEDRYSATVRLYVNEPAPRVVLSRSPRWYVGDLHMHSMHSDGRARSLSGVATPTPPHRIFDAAAVAGLDFAALTDHNTASHWLDVDRLQPYYDRTLLLHAREVTTYRGHANTIGERRFNEFRLESPTASPAALLARIKASGAFVSINHPTRPDDESCMGCGWNVVDREMMRSVNGVEVVNGELRDGDDAGWKFWADRLNEGARLTAIGGSDEHTVDDPKDQRLGVPATVVYASDLSESAIVAGLRSGRAYVRTRGPEGPALAFWAEIDGRRYDMGEVVPAAPAQAALMVTVRGADKQMLEWIRNGIVFGSEAAEGSHRRSLPVHDGDWISVRVRDERGVTVVGNAIYFGVRQ